MRTTPFLYNEALYEDISCTLCGGKKSRIIATRDRNGLPVSTVMCETCGLIFINPRMIRKWYDTYYQGEYRRQGAFYKGLFVPEEVVQYYEPKALFNKAHIHGQKILKEIVPYVVAGGFIVEIGSSSGGILEAFRQVLGGTVLGIEPSFDEARYAETEGIPTFQVLFENLTEKIAPIDTAICIRTLNHLLDPRVFVEWSHRELKLNGRIVLEVMNFYAVAKRLGCLSKAIQIDHVYMFTPQTLRALVENIGFTISYMNTDLDPDQEHMLLVA